MLAAMGPGSEKLFEYNPPFPYSLALLPQSGSEDIALGLGNGAASGRRSALTDGLGGVFRCWRFKAFLASRRSFIALASAANFERVA